MVKLKFYMQLVNVITIWRAIFLFILFYFSFTRLCTIMRCTKMAIIVCIIVGLWLSFCLFRGTLSED